MSKQQDAFMAERFDLRRFLLLSAGKLWWLLIGAVLGAVLAGGGYYLRHNMNPAPEVYRSDALYYITFTEGEQDTTQLYYNDYTWNDVLDSDQIAGVAATMAGGITKEQIAAATRVPTMSDIRMIHVYVETGDPETAESIQNAMGIALGYFAHQTEGFEEIVQWDRQPAEVLKEANLINRWIIAGAVLGAICALLFVAFVYVMDNKVRLEKDLYRIDGLRDKIVGSLFAGKKDKKEQEHLREIMAEALEGRSTLLIDWLGEEMPSEEVIAEIRALCPEGTNIAKAPMKPKMDAKSRKKAKKDNDKAAKKEQKKAADKDKATDTGREQEAEKDEIMLCCIPAGKTKAAQAERLWNELEMLDAAGKRDLPELVLLTNVKHGLHKAYYLGRNKD